MTQPSRVLFLPPGVVAPSQPVVSPTHLGSSYPFDRTFFEQSLPGAIAEFCKQVDCGVPVVELITIDGQVHYVVGISGVADTWVALHTRADNHDHDVQVFVPYATVFRVEVHPAEDDHRRRMGFLLEAQATDGRQKPKRAPAKRKAAKGA
jgi:hypothetical protein